jgi:DNA-binding XRE family transcriptional regulator
MSRRTDREHLDPVAVLLASLRKKWHWTQADMANHLGIQQSTVSDWETGEVHMKLDTARRILRMLDPGLELEMTIRVEDRPVVVDPEHAGIWIARP